MRGTNTCRKFDDDLERIRLEIEALEDGADDDIFQTRGCPIEEQLPPNTAIDLSDPAGIDAFDSTIKDRLQQLLPIEQEVNPRRHLPPLLMLDVVENFRSVVKGIPDDCLSFAAPNGDQSEFHRYADRIWNGEACRFADDFLRRVRPYVPFRCNLDCWIAKCLMRSICDEYSVPYSAVEKEPEGQFFLFTKAEGFAHKALRIAMETMYLSIYLSRLSIQIAAWLPYELMVVQAYRDPTLDAAFKGGLEYHAPRIHYQFSDAGFQICLGHVVDWLDHMGWFDPVLWSNQDLYRDWFWEAVDKGSDDWQRLDYTDCNDVDHAGVGEVRILTLRSRELPHQEPLASMSSPTG
ncbi:MAG: hypothetical protein Q9166_000791 [cf. Caloplaca sp. 2 TL-2023]